MRIRAKHYQTGKLVDVVCDRGSIMHVAEPTPRPADLEAGWIAPSFFDLQVNGCDGHSFNSPNLTMDNVRHVVAVCRRHGIGQLFPTLVTASFEDFCHGLTIVRQGCEQDRSLAHAIPGIHVEGPYISPEDGPRGAHPRRHVRAPDWDEFCRLQDAAGGRIRLLTLAPETPGAIPFIEKAVASGVVIALGHTGAAPATIRDAVRAGARLSTHLGNGSHAMLPRHDNYFLEQLAADDLWASLIADGHHLPPSLVKCITRVKTPARMILTCDASPLAGLPPGSYKDWGQEFEIVEGPHVEATTPLSSRGARGLRSCKIIVPGTTFLAGSWAFTDLCVGNIIKFAGVSLADAVDMASAHPCSLFGLPAVKIEPGFPANLVAFDWSPGGDVTIRATVSPSDNSVLLNETS